jgi:hypothetical protein
MFNVLKVVRGSHKVEGNFFILTLRNLYLYITVNRKFLCEIITLQQSKKTVAYLCGIHKAA